VPDKWADRWHVIGEGSNPILTIKKGEIKNLFTPFFYLCLEVWSFFTHGFGLPGGVPWDYQDPDVMRVVLAFEAHNRANFGAQEKMIKYQEAALRRRI